MAELATLAAMIGKDAIFTTKDGLKMVVHVDNVKMAYGNTRVVVSDAFGEQITVDSYRVQVAA